MAISTAQATAAPRDVALAGKTYRMTPLTDRDLGEFEAWVQDQQLVIVRRSLDGLSADDRQVLLKHAADRACRISINSPEALAAMSTRRGAAKLVWLGLRHEHPDITEDQVAELLSDERTINEAMDQVDQVNALPGSRKASKKKTVKHRKSKSR